MKIRTGALLAVPLIVITLAGCAAGGSGAEQTKEPRAASSEPALRIATDATHPPHDFLDKKGKLVGWENELMYAIADKMGRDVVYSKVGFATLIPGLQAGRYDMVFANMGITPERLQAVDMVTAFESGQAFLGNKAKGLKVDKLEDLCGISIGVTRGSTQAQLSEEQSAKCVADGKPAVQIKTFQSGDEIILAVESGRVDIYWTAQPIAQYYSTQPDSVLEIAGLVPIARSKTAIALPKGSELTEPVRKALQAVIDDGTYMKILKKWNLQDNAIKTAEIAH
jgi:polar amino acid transport system substrate-binding protein